MMNSRQSASVAIEEATEKYPITEEYFRSFNQNQFNQTVALFEEEGALVPPFDPPVVGQPAIQAYLEKEASNITAFPQQWEIGDAADGSRQVTVTGKVNAVVFKVNVAWYFTIAVSDESSDEKIRRVRIKLLASPAELLGLRSSSS